MAKTSISLKNVSDQYKLGTSRFNAVPDYAFRLLLGSSEIANYGVNSPTLNFGPVKPYNESVKFVKSSSQYLNVDALASNMAVPTPNGFSLSFWVNMNVLTNGTDNISNNWITFGDGDTGGTGFTFGAFYEGQTKFRFISNGYIFFKSFGGLGSINTWYHIVYTYNPIGNVSFYYINGGYNATSTAFSPNTFTATTLRFANTPYLNGSMEDFRFYLRPITEAQSLLIYNERNIA